MHNTVIAYLVVVLFCFAPLLQLPHHLREYLPNFCHYRLNGHVDYVFYVKMHHILICQTGRWLEDFEKQNFVKLLEEI